MRLVTIVLNAAYSHVPPSTAEAKAALRVQPRATSLRNIQFVGRGYNLVEGCPREPSGKIDSGFRLPVIDQVYFHGQYTPDGLYALPDHIDAVQLPSATLSSTVTKMTQEAQYKKQLDASVEVSAAASMERLFETRFSASVTYQSTAESLRKDDSNFVDIEAQVSSYRASIKLPPTSRDLPLSEDFRAAVKTLPLSAETEELKEVFKSFVANFGTHYANTVWFGGTATQRYMLSMRSATLIRSYSTPLCRRAGAAVMLVF